MQPIQVINIINMHVTLYVLSLSLACNAAKQEAGKTANAKNKSKNRRKRCQVIDFFAMGIFDRRLHRRREHGCSESPALDCR